MTTIPLDDWLRTAPTGVVSLAASLLAAFVAIATTVFVQWLTGRRSRTDFLSRKLEEVWDQVQIIMEESGTLFDSSSELIGDDGFVGKREYVSPRGINFSYIKLKKLVVLYFPSLWPRCSSCNKLCSKITDFNTKFEFAVAVDSEHHLNLHLAHLAELAAMMQEIIGNRRKLVKDYVVPRPWLTASHCDATSKSPKYGRGFIGIMVRIADYDGKQAAELTGVAESSPADKAGLCVGDYITHIDGVPISDLSRHAAKSALKSRANRVIELQLKLLTGELKVVSILVTPVFPFTDPTLPGSPV